MIGVMQDIDQIISVGESVAIDENYNVYREMEKCFKLRNREIGGDIFDGDRLTIKNANEHDGQYNLDL
jgi:hypothetical protein